MTERILAIDEAVAVETPVLHGISKETINVCISDGNIWHPVALPANLSYLKEETGAVHVNEMQFDVAGTMYEKAETLRPGHVYEIFPLDKKKFDNFLEEHRIQH